MAINQQFVIAAAALALAEIASLTVADPPTPSGPAAAQVENRVDEASLTTIRLTPKAETRLAIRTVPIESKAVPQLSTYPGEVVFPPGRHVTISAPVPGLITLSKDSDKPPASGTRFSTDQPVFGLIPGIAGGGVVLATADRISMAKALADVMAARAEAEGQLHEAEVRVAAARVKRDRAESLQKQNAGSQRALDEARAEYDIAEAAQAAAQSRLNALATVLSDLQAGKSAAIPLFPPFDGVLRAIHVAPGQLVAGGTQLFELGAEDPLWIRVPVYAGDPMRFALLDSAQVRGLGDRSNAPARAARQVFPAGTASPTATTVDLYFETSNARGELRPGQRVAVMISTQTVEKRNTVPFTAILYDIHGGTWVYQTSAPQTYVRSRVVVRSVVDNVAVLSAGPPAGTKVVTDGAAELFGTEFGAGK